MISGDYQEIPKAKWEVVLSETKDAWKNQEIPLRSWEAAKGERLMVRNKDFSLPVFDTFLNLVQVAMFRDKLKNPSILEIGAGNAFYGELLLAAGVTCRYQACDHSMTFREFTLQRNPSLRYVLADATKLPHDDQSIDIVVVGGCLLHVPSWKKALREAYRVSKKWVMVTRVPVTERRSTTLYKKLAYDVPCLEWLFSKKDFYEATKEAGLYLEDVRFVTGDPDEGHYSYLFSKVES